MRIPIPNSFGVRLREFNHHHKPAGSPDGGQFASADGGYFAHADAAFDKNHAARAAGKWSLKDRDSARSEGGAIGDIYLTAAQKKAQDPEAAKGMLIGSTGTFDITKMKSRKFLYNPTTEELAIGGETSAGGSLMHTDALEEALKAAGDSRLNEPIDKYSYSIPAYDQFTIHGFMGTKPEHVAEAHPAGQVITYALDNGTAMLTPERNDKVAKLLQKIKDRGGMTKDTILGGPYAYGPKKTVGESTTFGYLFKKAARVRPVKVAHWSDLAPKPRAPRKKKVA